MYIRKPLILLCFINHLITYIRSLSVRQVQLCSQICVKVINYLNVIKNYIFPSTSESLFCFANAYFADFYY